MCSRAGAVCVGGGGGEHDRRTTSTGPRAKAQGGSSGSRAQNKKKKRAKRRASEECARVSQSDESQTVYAALVVSSEWEGFAKERNDDSIFSIFRNDLWEKLTFPLLLFGGTQRSNLHVPVLLVFSYFNQFFWAVFLLLG